MAIYLGRSAHHDILCGLVHRERDDLTDALLACQKHDHTVYAGGDTCMGRSSVAECVVHGREFGFHVVLAQTNHLEGLDHDLRIVVTNGTGGELYTVADQIVLVRVDGQRGS